MSEDNQDNINNAENADVVTETETTEVPETVIKFCIYFNTSLENNNFYDVRQCYVDIYNKITEQLYKNSPWPKYELIKPEVADATELFGLLYKEAYYRHIYSRLTPTLEQRIESWENYCALFDFFLNTSEPFDQDMPFQWLWDMIDEFIYQFQSFSQYCWNLKSKTSEEIEKIKANTDTWNVTKVLNYLHLFMSKSNIIAYLKQDKSKAITSGESGSDFSQITFYRMMGYFSIIGLARLHCILGDFDLALKTLDSIDASRKDGLYLRVTACNITFRYYLGFIYLITRRYYEAIRSFSRVLAYINRNEHNNKSYQREQNLKKNDQMCNLLAIAISLYPHNLDENLSQILKEKCGDKLARMQKGDERAFEEAFCFACPKFVSPARPDYDDTEFVYNQEFNLQLSLFMKQIHQQAILPTIRSYLKLYTTIPLSKLATFLDVEENELRNSLLLYKLKTRKFDSDYGRNNRASSKDVDFSIVDDMIHVSDTKVARRYGLHFLNGINKFEDVIRDLDNTKYQK